MGLLAAWHFLYGWVVPPQSASGPWTECGPLSQWLVLDQQVHQAAERAAKTEILQDLCCQRAGNHRDGGPDQSSPKGRHQQAVKALLQRGHLQCSRTAIPGCPEEGRLLAEAALWPLGLCMKKINISGCYKLHLIIGINNVIVLKIGIIFRASFQTRFFHEFF